MFKSSLVNNNRKSSSRFSSAFTIVELLVVIVVIAILAAIVLVSYNGITSMAKTASLKSDLSNSAQQIKIYQVSHDTYPESVTDCPNPANNNICLKSSNGATYTSWSHSNTNPRGFTLVETSADRSAKWQITDGSGPTEAKTGKLTATTPASLAAASSEPYDAYELVVSPDGKSAYATNRMLEGISSISMYSRDTTTGVLSPLSPDTIAAEKYSSGIAISPDGSSVYVANEFSNTVSMYSRNATTGALTALPTPTIATGGDPVGVAVSPDSKSVYVTNEYSGTISMYSRSTTTGALTALPTPTIDAEPEQGPINIDISPDGNYVYVADDDVILIYSRDSSTGALTALSPATIAMTGRFGDSQHIAISPDGSSVYVTTVYGWNMTTYSRNGITGILTAPNPLTIGSGGSPYSVTISPDGNSVYVLEGLIYMYNRN